MDPADLTALAAALDLPFRARREQHLYTRRGHGRVNAEATVPPPRKIDLLDHVLATRSRAHLHLPLKVIGALPGADFTTVSHAVSLTSRLLASQEQATRRPTPQHPAAHPRRPAPLRRQPRHHHPPADGAAAPPHDTVATPTHRKHRLFWNGYPPAEIAQERRS